MVSAALEFMDVGKSFGGVAAVQNVSFSVAPGEVVSLAGENGAGKSTIKNLVAGLLRPDTGTVTLFGGPQHSSVAGVRAQGVSTVHQEISLFPHLSVAENLLINKLGNRARFGVSQRRLEAEAQPYLDLVGARFSPRVLVESLATGETQLVEIAKSLVSSPKLLVLDEPTASLTMTEREFVFSAVERLRADGVAVLFISHFLEEIFRLSDRVIVMRDGRVVTDRRADELDRSSLEELMVGRELSAGFPGLAEPSDEVALRVSNIGDNAVIDNVSFDIRKGEIFGLAGLMGSGRTEVARAVFGLATAAGSVEVFGEPIRRADPRAAIAAGIAFVTEDRRDEGIFLARPISETLSVATLSRLVRPRWTGILSRRLEHAQTKRQAEVMGITARGGLGADGGSLSGGNQQKVVMSKWLETSPRVLILDEPTRGIDVGAKAEIYRILTGLARDGLAILLISSEMEEVLGLSHRIGVMAGGQLTSVIDRADADQRKLIRLATGGQG